MYLCTQNGFNNNNRKKKLLKLLLHILLIACHTHTFRCENPVPCGAGGLLDDAHDTVHILVVHAHFIEDEEEDISQLSIFVSETFRTFAPKVTTD